MAIYLLADPGSKLNFSHDWTPWLTSGTEGSPTDTIASRQWSITPMNPGSPDTPILTGDTSDIVFVEGLEAGMVYHLTEHVIAASGNADDRTIVIRCDPT